MGVVERDADQSPRAHHASQRTPVCPGIAAGAMTEHDRGESSAAARLQQDALEIDVRTVERADQRPRRSRRGLRIPGDRKSGVARRARGHTDVGVTMTRRQRTEQRDDQDGPKPAGHGRDEARGGRRISLSHSACRSAAHRFLSATIGRQRLAFLCRPVCLILTEREDELSIFRNASCSSTQLEATDGKSTEGSQQHFRKSNAEPEGQFTASAATTR